MLLSELVETSQAVAATAARGGKSALLADCLRRLAPDEVVIGVAYLSGRPRQRQTGIGYAALRDLPPAAAAPSLTLRAVDASLEQVGAQTGPASQAERRRLVNALLGRATAAEQDFLARLLVGELRQGALDGVMLEAVAKAGDVPLGDLRRALLLRGDPLAVAEVALRDGLGGVRGLRLEVGRPVQPMLAQPASSLADALARAAPASLDWKLDGVRVQVHRLGDDVRVFTRTLDDVTPRVPELVVAARSLPIRAAVLDGEAIALRPDGRPRPFQETAARFASSVDVARAGARVPLTLFLFDALHLDGEDVLDRPLQERRAALAGAVPRDLLVTSLETDDHAAAAAFLADALARGQEGVMVKALAAPYEAGRRGGAWLMVKAARTVDLVVLAAEWGHGRRRGWLSNLHLGARDQASGGFVMLGKTFKGLTDEVLEWQTRRLLELEAGRDGGTVYVRPEQVVEVAFEGTQRSPCYPGGMALRFARVVRYRPDKRAADADTLEAVLAPGFRAG